MFSTQIWGSRPPSSKNRASHESMIFASADGRKLQVISEYKFVKQFNLIPSEPMGGLVFKMGKQKIPSVLIFIYCFKKWLSAKKFTRFSSSGKFVNCRNCCFSVYKKHPVATFFNFSNCHWFCKGRSITLFGQSVKSSRI